MGHFNHSILLASHKCSSLLGGGTLIHQIPWCLLCLPLAATICFGTAALWTASRHAVIFPSDSTEKGKHINYSSLGADFIYPSRNEIFVCVCVCVSSAIFFLRHCRTAPSFACSRRDSAEYINFREENYFSTNYALHCMPWESQGRSSALFLHTCCIILHF